MTPKTQKEIAGTMLLARRPFTGRNVSVTISDDIAVLRLYDTAICTLMPDNSMLVYAGEWLTSTTAAYLNHVEGLRVYKAKGQWYVNDIPWDGQVLVIPPTTASNVADLLKVAGRKMEAAQAAYDAVAAEVVHEVAEGYVRAFGCKEFFMGMGTWWFIDRKGEGVDIQEFDDFIWKHRLNNESVEIKL